MITMILYSPSFFPTLEQNLQKRVFMKHLLRPLLLCILNVCVIYAETHNNYSRSFTVLRPAYDLIEAQHQLIDEAMYDQNSSGTGQAYFVYQHALDHDLSSGKFARYFLPNGKNQLLVAGDSVPDAQCIRNVRAEWLGLPDNFSGYLCIRPEHMQYGGVFAYHQNLDTLIQHGFFKQSFVSVTIPVINVRTDLNLHQSEVRNPGTTYPRDIIEAFNQPSWQYDKINGPQEKAAIAEIAVRYGRVFMHENDNYMVYYTGLVIPAAHKPLATYLYNAYVGNRYHVGLNGGLNIQARLNRSDCGPLWAWFVMLDGNYLFKNTQYRTLDLKRKQWSRFLLLTRECTPGVATPGVNILTQEMHVRPYGIYNFASGLRIKNGWYEIEVGYNLWGHPQEYLKLENDFFTDFGIMGESSDPMVAKSSSKSTIANQAPSDDTFVHIRQSDLDIYSGSAGSALNHTFLLSFGIHQTYSTIQWTFGGGIFTEIAHLNRPVPSWGGWLKVAATF